MKQSIPDVLVFKTYMRGQERVGGVVGGGGWAGRVALLNATGQSNGAEYLPGVP